ncbi:serine--tRNA ligase [Buchnera aphidicola]|uniref:serine--tRNA ligase n=1 Tax=Buchnera aphidicola TaxID=9 RepID=UPI0030EE5A24
MIDYKMLKKYPEIFKKKLYLKNFNLDVSKFLRLEKNRKYIQIKTENLRFQQKNLSKSISNINLSIKKKNKIRKILIELSDKFTLFKKKLSKVKNKIYKYMSYIPNIPSLDTPKGIKKSNNKKIFSWGKKKKFNFLVKNHVELGESIQGFDWKVASKISNSKFAIIKGKLAFLHRALGQFMIDFHIENHGYQEFYVPYLVNESSIFGTGQLPKFYKNLFCIKKIIKNNLKKLHKEKKYFLIPTAEVSLTNIAKDKIFKEHELPMMCISKTPCFRSESKNYGKNNKGLIRNNQFEKVELVKFVHPKHSFLSLEKLTEHAEKILQVLELPYRKILLCSGELGFSSFKTYDLEVWFPSIKKYQEVSSCSNMIDFQARRINAKYFDIKKKKNCYIHTLNGSGLAVGRTLAAILENNQNSNGSINIPKVLCKRYMKGMKKI